MENVSQIHHSTAQGGHEGTTEGINHEQHAHSNVPQLERHNKHLLVDSCRNYLHGTKLFSNEDDQNTTRKSPGRNESIIIIMKIALSLHKNFSDRVLEEVIDVWNRKSRWIVV